MESLTTPTRVVVDVLDINLLSSFASKFRHDLVRLLYKLHKINDLLLGHIEELVQLDKSEQAASLMENAFKDCPVSTGAGKDTVLL